MDTKSNIKFYFQILKIDIAIFFQKIVLAYWEYKGNRLKYKTSYILYKENMKRK